MLVSDSRAPALHHRGELVARLERHRRASGAIQRADLVKGVVHHAGRPVILQQAGIERERRLAGVGAEVGLAVLDIRPAHVVQHVAERVGDRRLEAARDERRDRAVAGFQLLGSVRHLGQRRRICDAALGEHVLAVIDDRAFNVGGNAGELAADRRRFHQGRAQAGEIVVRRDVGLELGEIHVPAGLRELLALARHESHEHVHLVAARVEHGDEPLAHLLFLIRINPQRHAGQLLELGLMTRDRVADGVVVGQEIDRRPFVLHPVEIRSVRGLLGSKQGEDGETWGVNSHGA